MMIVGIDPGISGGVVVLDDKSNFVSMHAGIPNIHSLIEFLRILPETLKVKFYIEKAQSMPKQGISSAFNYGRGFGEIIGAITALGWPIELIPASVWTKTMLRDAPKHLKGKDRAAHMARQLFPSLDLRQTARCKKAHSGLADALLIAEYGRRTLHSYAS